MIILCTNHMMLLQSTVVGAADTRGLGPQKCGCWISEARKIRWNNDSWWVWSMINWCTDAWMHWYSNALMTPGYNDHMNNDAMMTGCIDGLMHWFTDGLMYRCIGALKNRCIYVLENCCTDALDKLIYTLMHKFLIHRHIAVLIPAAGCIDALKNWWLKVLYIYIDAQIHWCINWLSANVRKCMRTLKHSTEI